MQNIFRIIEDKDIVYSLKKLRVVRKRGIAGTLVFVMFDHDALLTGLAEHIRKNKVFHRVGGDLNWQSLTIDQWDEQMNQKLNSTTTNNDAESAAQRTRSVSEKKDPVIADEIPPFDITISMANEYGKAAVMVLYGVEILNQGSQFSMDNIQSQQACTFVARRLKCLEAVDLASTT